MADNRNILRRIFRKKQAGLITPSAIGDDTYLLRVTMYNEEGQSREVRVLFDRSQVQAEIDKENDRHTARIRDLNALTDLFDEADGVGV
jgi:hypothetical protein